MGVNLTLVARRTELLEALAQELVRRHGIAVRVAPEDLSDEAAPARLRSLLDTEGLRIKLLVNNAAAGRWGRFENCDAESYRQLISLNITALTAMCREFLPHLASHPRSAVINVSSQAAYQPVPYMAVYAATKAYVQHFSLALYEEWRERGIHVQTLVPGPTISEFDAKAGAYASAVAERHSPAQAVRAALTHLTHDGPLTLSAQGVWKQRLFAGLFPPRVVVREVAKMFRPPEET